MDAHRFLEHLNNPSLWHTAVKEPWEKLTQQYPYFAQAHFIHYAIATSHTKEDVTSLATYKQDPYLFAAFVAKANEPAPKPKVVPEIPVEEPPKPTEEPITPIEEPKEPVDEPITPVEESIDTKKEEQDILTLINELPNTNPIILNKSNKTQTEPSPKPIEVHEAPKVEETITEEDDSDKSLMVMMSFTDWLNYFKTKRERELSEEKDKKALKTSWQKEKLAAAVEEDVDEIPEPIFKQAMDSIAMESSMMSESLAKILAAQGKIDKAIDMYKKLSLRNPEKRSYFADLIEHLNSKRD
jgi:hypothetical protein